MQSCIHGEKKMNQSIPRLYLSTSNGKWRAIYRESPLCADCDRATAESVARKCQKEELADVVWNGDIGEFVPF
jgi:hypothetical protein